MIFLIRIGRGSFCSQSPLLQGLLRKSPKEVEIDVSAGFLSIFFEQTKKYFPDYAGPPATSSSKKCSNI